MYKKKQIFWALIVSCSLLFLTTKLYAMNPSCQEHTVKDTIPAVHNQQKDTIPFINALQKDSLPTINNEKLEWGSADGETKITKLFVNDKEIKTKNVNIDMSKIKQMATKKAKDGSSHLYIYTE